MSLVTSQSHREINRPNLGRLFLTNEFGLFFLIVVFGLLFFTLSSGFLSSFNIAVMSRAAAINVMIGFSMMAVIATGGLSLAVGAIGVCAAMSCGWLLEVMGLPWPFALTAATLGGGLRGGVTEGQGGVEWVPQ